MLSIVSDANIWATDRRSFLINYTLFYCADYHFCPISLPLPSRILPSVKLPPTCSFVMPQSSPLFYYDCAVLPPCIAGVAPNSSRASSFQIRPFVRHRQLRRIPATINTLWNNNNSIRGESNYFTMTVYEQVAIDHRLGESRLFAFC